MLHRPLAESGYGKPAAEADELRRPHRRAIGDDCRSRSPAAASRTRRASRCRRRRDAPENTSTDTEIEMMQNRPTPDRVEDVLPGEFPRDRGRAGPRRRRHRRDHLLHQHLQPQRDAGGRPAREEGGRARPRRAKPRSRRSLAPGSRVVTRLSEKTGLQPYLDQLGFQLVGYGCTTCIGNSRPARAASSRTRSPSTTRGRQRAVGQPQLRGARAPEHQGELPHEPAARRGLRARGPRGHRPDAASRSAPARTAARVPARHLADDAEVGALLAAALSTRRRTAGCTATSPRQNPMWNEIPATVGKVYEWDHELDLHPGAAVLRPASRSSPSRCSDDPRRARAGDLRRFSHHRPHQPRRRHQADLARRRYLLRERRGGRGLQQLRLPPRQRRVMMRGTFANVRIKNLMVPGVEGGVTVHQPDGEQMTIYDAAMTLPGRRHAARGLRRPGVRHRQLARLGGQGHAAARRERGRSRRASSASTAATSCGMGVLPAAIPRRHQRARRSGSTAPKRSTSSGLEAAHRAEARP